MSKFVLLRIYNVNRFTRNSNAYVRSMKTCVMKTLGASTPVCSQLVSSTNNLSTRTFQHVAYIQCHLSNGPPTNGVDDDRRYMERDASHKRTNTRTPKTCYGAWVCASPSRTLITVGVVKTAIEKLQPSAAGWRWSKLSVFDTILTGSRSAGVLT